MKIKFILSLLALFAFLSTAIGGYLYYSSLKEAVSKEAERHIETRMAMMQNNLSSFLSENIKTAKALAGLKAVQQALINKDNASLAEANTILDLFHNTIDVEVCYLMDSQGNTIASSNRYDKDSFVGQNFAFRPYFQQAIQGKLATYLALGIASGRRGAYYSYPVLGRDRRTPIGVAVIKASIEFIEEKLATTEDEIVLVTDPQGIIFVSSRRDWLYQALSRLSPEEAAHIAGTQQFGSGPWTWTGLTLSGQNLAVGADGKQYQMRQLPLDNYPGWRLIYLQGPQAFAKKIADPLLKTTGYIILLLCGMVSLAVSLLCWKAFREIAQRKVAETALQKTSHEVLTLNQEMEALVMERTMSEMALGIADGIRNPLFIIGGFSNRLLKKTDLNDPARIWAAAIAEEAKRLEQMVKRFEALAQRKEAFFTREDLNEIIREVLDMLHSEIKGKDIHLTKVLHPQPCIGRLNRHLIRIALTHLLRNAIEASAPGGEIKVTTLAERESVLVTIEDQGKGMSPEVTEKIFEPFYTIEVGGTGLGMVFSRQIVDEHRGSIKLESQVGLGTKVTIRLPLRFEEPLHLSRQTVEP